MDKTSVPTIAPADHSTHAAGSGNNHHGAAPSDSATAGLSSPQDVLHNPSRHVPTNYIQGTRGRVAIFVACVIVGLGALFVFGYLLRHRQDSNQAAATEKTASTAVEVDVVRVKSADRDKRLVLPGEARPFFEATIFARTSGYLKDLLVDIGDRVKEGQVLATIETPDLDDQLVASHAKLDELKAQVHVAETSLAFARISFERWSQSAAEGAVSKQETDQKKSEMDSCVAKLEAARAQVALGEADVQRLETMDKFKEVTAPFDGTVTDRRVDPGELVTAGSTSNTTALFVISRSDKVRAFVDVPQNAAPDIKVGMAATTEYGGKKFAGKVDRTAESIDMSTRTLRVEVLIENPDRALLPGTYLQVTFLTTREHGPLQVPSSALSFHTSGPQVAIVAHDGKVSFRDVTITRDSGDFVEVDGLTGGETVALNIDNSVVEGEVVNAHESGAGAAVIKDAKPSDADHLQGHSSIH